MMYCGDFEMHCGDFWMHRRIVVYVNVSVKERCPKFEKGKINACPKGSNWTKINFELNVYLSNYHLKIIYILLYIEIILIKTSI